MAGTLHMTLKREWFVKILHGQKTEEYREVKPYWTRRLAHQYGTITFRNGYEADSPVMEVEYLGFSITRVNIPGTIAGEVYALKLGRIIRTERCDHLKPIAQLSLYQ